MIKCNCSDGRCEVEIRGTTVDLLLDCVVLIRAIDTSFKQGKGKAAETDDKYLTVHEFLKNHLTEVAFDDIEDFGKALDESIEDAKDPAKPKKKKKDIYKGVDCDKLEQALKLMREGLGVGE